MHGLVYLEAAKVEEGEAVVFEDLALRELSDMVELDIQLRGHLLVNEELEDVRLDQVHAVLQLLAESLHKDDNGLVFPTIEVALVGWQF